MEACGQEGRGSTWVVAPTRRRRRSTSTRPNIFVFPTSFPVRGSVKIAQYQGKRKDFTCCRA
jgi:hypothetical protein